MTIRVPVDEASARLRELLQAALRGEDVLIASDDDGAEERVVRLVAVSDKHRGAVFGSGKGLFRMAGDFDDPLPDFGQHVSPTGIM